jgi:hypothetical protein
METDPLSSPGSRKRKEKPFSDLVNSEITTENHFDKDLDNPMGDTVARYDVNGGSSADEVVKKVLKKKKVMSAVEGQTGSPSGSVKKPAKVATPLVKSKQQTMGTLGFFAKKDKVSKNGDVTGADKCNGHEDVNTRPELQPAPAPASDSLPHGTSGDEDAMNQSAMLMLSAEIPVSVSVSVSSSENDQVLLDESPSKRKRQTKSPVKKSDVEATASVIPSATSPAVVTEASEDEPLKRETRSLRARTKPLNYANSDDGSETLKEEEKVHPFFQQGKKKEKEASEFSFSIYFFIYLFLKIFLIVF